LVLFIKYSGHQIKEDRMGGACGTYGEVKTVCKVMVRKPEGKRPLGRRRLAWEDNIKVGFK
jgi:hypothetical protein